MPKNIKKTIGWDYDGVISEGLLLGKDDVVITGRPETDEEEIREIVGNKVPIYFFPDQEELTEENMNVKIGTWKAKKIKELGVDKFYEDTPEQILLIKELTKAEVVPVIDGVAVEKMKFIIFTYDGMILSVAKKLIDEGNEVIVGMVDNVKNIFTDHQIKEGAFKPEDPKKKQERWALYDGVFTKHSAEHLLKEMKKLKDKQEWFIMADSNCLFRFCSEAYDMGFHNGFFPTEEDRDFEENRTKGKDFVREHYDLEIGEVHEFKSVDDAKEFISTSDKTWCVKSQGDLGDTFIPQSKDPEMINQEIIANLESQRKNLESDGFILEEFLTDIIELTPQVIFYDGVPCYYSLDLENKPMGSGNIGAQVGCAQNLIIQTHESDLLNKLAFPPIVYEMAKQHHGMFVWDCSILVSNGKNYFGEFCSNRFGWDSFPTELSMCQSHTLYFTKIMKGMDPCYKQFGAGVRILNIGANGEVVRDADINVTDERNVYLYDAYEEDGIYKTVGGKWDVAVITGCGDDPYKAIEECYENCERVTLESKYIRPQFDMLSYSYNSAIMNRRDYAVSHNLINENYDNETEPEASPIGVESSNPETSKNL